jgi:hypothetical protein
MEFFFFSPSQFCDVDQEVIIYKHILPKFGDIRNMKVEIC